MYLSSIFDSTLNTHTSEKGKKMKKLFLSLLIVISAVISISCGGGDNGQTEPYVVYDMWDYIVSKTTITKSFDNYETDSNFNPIDGPFINAGQIRNTVLSSDRVHYEEMEDGKVTLSAIFTLQSETIMVDAEGEQGTLGRYRTINSPFGTCIVYAHHNTYSPVLGYIYEDVIEIKCDELSEFHAKGIGKVVSQGMLTLEFGDQTIIKYGVSVANLE